MKVDVSCFRHCQQIHDAFLALGNPLIFLGREQYVRRPPPVGNEDWASFRGSFRPARVLIEFSTGQLGNGHNVLPSSRSNVATL